jgi:hypothetical protein
MRVNFRQIVDFDASRLRGHVDRFATTNHRRFIELRYSGITHFSRALFVLTLVELSLVELTVVFRMLLYRGQPLTTAVPIDEQKR